MFCFSFSLFLYDLRCVFPLFFLVLRDMFFVTLLFFVCFGMGLLFECFLMYILAFCGLYNIIKMLWF